MGTLNGKVSPGLSFVGNRKPLRPLLKESDELTMPQEY